MKLTKYNHACLLVEDSGKKLLIDPGVFTFSDKLKPADIGAVDIIVLTHSHQDHTWPDNIKAFQSLGSPVIIAGPETISELNAENINAQSLTSGEEQEIAGFKLQAYPATHGPMPVPKPVENFAYLINGRLLHPGDSFVTNGLPHSEILALPTQGPWARLVDVVEYGQAMRPQLALAIHDALYTPDFGHTMNGYLEQIFQSDNVKFKSMQAGESVEV